MKKIERKILIRLKAEQKYQEHRAAEYGNAGEIAKGLKKAREIVIRAYKEEEDERRKRKISKEGQLSGSTGDSHAVGQSEAARPGG